MKKLIKRFGWSREAYLFDSTAYVLKSFVGIFTAFLVARPNVLLSKDMISVLFGLMLTLEPVAVTGIRVGWQQVTATVVGAAATALIVVLGGNTALTVALGVAFTIYVSIKLNWRIVSPVAYFTAIYMTQFVQTDAAGAPSMVLTFQLRMAALLCGVVIAILINMVFYQLGYRKMMKKRVLFLLEEQKKILAAGVENLDTAMDLMPQHFADIEWVYAHWQDRKKEMDRLPGGKTGKSELTQAGDQLKLIKEAAHLLYDIGMTVETEAMSPEESARLKALMKRWTTGLKMDKLDFSVALSSVELGEFSNRRVENNVHRMEERYRKLA